MTGVQIIRRLALLLLLVALASVIVVACGGDDDDDDAEDAAATPTTEQADVGQAETESESDPTEPGDQPATPTEAADNVATAGEDIPTATASATPEGGAESIPLSVLVIPPERDASIPQNGRVLGDPEAAVEIVEYGDFQ